MTNKNVVRSLTEAHPLLVTSARWGFRVTLPAGSVQEKGDGAPVWNLPDGVRLAVRRHEVPMPAAKLERTLSMRAATGSTVRTYELTVKRAKTVHVVTLTSGLGPDEDELAHRVLESFRLDGEEGATDEGTAPRERRRPVVSKKVRRKAFNDRVQRLIRESPSCRWRCVCGGTFVDQTPLWATVLAGAVGGILGGVLIRSMCGSEKCNQCGMVRRRS